MASMGEQFGVDTWAIDAMVRLACVVHGTNYFRRGRTVEDMGLKGLRVSEIMRYVQEGVVKLIYTLAGVQKSLPGQRPALPGASGLLSHPLPHSAEYRAQQAERQ